MPDVVITLTVRQHEHKVTTDRGFFSSPEHNGSYLNHPLAKTSKEIAMNTITRWDQSRGLTLRDQVNRLFEDNLTRDRSGHADLATWAPPVDIYETEHELVVKADLPDLQDKDIDVRVENNTLTIRGERKLRRTSTRTTTSELNAPMVRSCGASPCRTRSVPKTFGPTI